MKLKFSLTVFYVLFLASFVCQASTKVVSVGVAHFPPYSIVEGDNISGVEVDIIRESLNIMGYQAKFVSYPYGRLPLAFSSKQVESTIVTLKNFPNIKVYYSDIVLPEYQTVAVHLAKNKLKVDSISDLEATSVIAHQRAHLFYGDEFKAIAEKNKEASIYQETARQESQVRMLFKDRVDVIVLAHEIFMYFKSRADYKERDRAHTVSKIFGEKFGFYNAFWEPKVRDDFDIGLAKIKENGTYHKILTQYLEVYKANASLDEPTKLL